MAKELDPKLYGLDDPEKVWPEDVLTEEEWMLVKAHPVRGAEMIRGVKFLERVTDMVRHHHERVDGKGYPDGLKGDEISIGAKIVNVADAFDAMTTDRPYRAGFTVEKAVEQMEEKAGSQFAAEIVQVFVAVLRGGRIQVTKSAKRAPGGAGASTGSLATP